MKKFLSLIYVLVASWAPSAFATVSVTNPSNGSTVSPSVDFVASANTTTCSKGVGSMGIYVDNTLLYQVSGIHLSKVLTLGNGPHNAVVKEWDLCGGASMTSVGFTVSTLAGVAVVTPYNASSVSSPVAYIANATTGCSAGIGAMGVFVDGRLAYKGAGSKLNTSVPMAAGNHKTVVQAWDNCGGGSSSQVLLNVAGKGTTMTNLQAAPGWHQWGELPPVYDICSAPCSGIQWSMNKHVSTPSLSGNATQFNLSGTRAYSDALWSNPVLGQGAQYGFTDSNHTLLPTLHNFNLDMSVFVTDLTATQDLEFDINWYGNGLGLEWGTECNHLADGVWDIWVNAPAKWIPTSIPCKLNNNAWNHIVLQVQREDNNDLLYQTLSVNGVTYNINQTVGPFRVPYGWWGMTVNYQMDGNSRMAANTTYVDNMNFSYF